MNQEKPRQLNAAAEIEQQDDFSSYVAELQLHMSLQARKLVPNLSPGQGANFPENSVEALLQDSQANLEKLISRQKL
ncbi:MAG: hypothetical protein AAGG02_02035 [Cyanobacteria bacterium P01_H01_bin.15]